MMDRKAGYHIAKILLDIMAKIPAPLLKVLPRTIGSLWYLLDKHHRRIAEQNMEIAFAGELTEAERRRLVLSNFIQLARVALEIPRLKKINRKNVSSYVTVRGIDNLKHAIGRKRGVLVLTAHLGNWEMMAVAAPLIFGLPLNILVRPLDNPIFDEILTGIRERTGNRVLDKDKAAGIIGRKLKNNEMIGILLDQNSSWYEGVYVPFFGRVACTNKGMALLALRYRATVIPAFNIRMPDGRYRITIDPPVELVRTGDIRADVEANTIIFNRIIEKHIRMAPDNWLWVHRRWRIKKVPEAVKRRYPVLYGDGSA